MGKSIASATSVRDPNFRIVTTSKSAKLAGGLAFDAKHGSAEPHDVLASGPHDRRAALVRAQRPNRCDNTYVTL